MSTNYSQAGAELISEAKRSKPAVFAFRFFALYFFLQAFPFDWRFYYEIASIKWSALQFFDIFNLAHYTTRFSAGPQRFTDWAIIALIATVGTIIWSFTGFWAAVNNQKLYYWVRVLVRYRLAIALVAYGFIKFFPIQVPYPSLGNLNTAYGDFTRWKLFSLSLGIVPGYQSFLGAVEILLGVLLLFRRTASIGAFFVIIFTGNVLMSNLAYEGGEIVYSFYLITLALFVLSFDIVRLVQLLILQKPALPNTFKPVYEGLQVYTRLIVKSACIFFFVVLYGFKANQAYKKGPFRFPDQKSLVVSPGKYNVSSFILNKDSLPYSTTDSIRWRDVVFENWNTLSVRGNFPAPIDSNNLENFTSGVEAKRYEQEGTSGRRYYSYTVDSLNHTILLQNQHPQFNKDVFTLHYERRNDSTLLLSGVNARNDSLLIVLEKIRKKYLLEEVARTGRQKPIRL